MTLIVLDHELMAHAVECWDCKPDTMGSNPTWIRLSISTISNQNNIYIYIYIYICMAAFNILNLKTFYLHRYSGIYNVCRSIGDFTDV